MTREEADALLCEYFTPDIAYGDPEWWREMLGAICECGTETAARRFLQTGEMP